MKYSWFLFLFLLGSAALGQHLIEGTVLNSETGKPVPFASIGIVGTSTSASSNVNGQFAISTFEYGTFVIACVGYQTRKINVESNNIVVELKPSVQQLETLVIVANKVNPRKVVKKAFANIQRNYNTAPFRQSYFYRHYCKDNDVYGRLIEAYVDVWKPDGYQSRKDNAGEKESIRVTQLRRSLDNTEMARGHEPMEIASILQSDFVAYQSKNRVEHVSFYTDLSTMRANFHDYDFEFYGKSEYNGKEVYTIHYTYKRDSVLTTSGAYLNLTQIEGEIFVTTNDFAIVKVEEQKVFENNSTYTLALYRKYNNHYYPYHFVKEGESTSSDSSAHFFHIELMSTDISNGTEFAFESSILNKKSLLAIEYDSSFWAGQTMLKASPLEEQIIYDLGQGIPLDQQFQLYQQHEENTHDGEVNGASKFEWLRDYHKLKKPMYKVVWSEGINTYISEMEWAKVMSTKIGNRMAFVFLAANVEQSLWHRIVSQYNLRANNIYNYRIDDNKVLKELDVKSYPSFILLNKNGEVVPQTKRPSDATLVLDLEKFIAQ